MLAQAKITILLLASGVVGGAYLLFVPPGSRMDRQLLEVARDGDLAKVKETLAAGANPKFGRAPSRFQKLTEEYPDPELGYTALHYGAICNHPEVVKALLDAGAPVDAQSALGNTPLMLATGQLDIQAVGLLLDHGAKRELRNREGKSASDFAQKRNMTAKARTLANLVEIKGST